MIDTISAIVDDPNATVVDDFESGTSGITTYAEGGASLAVAGSNDAHAGNYAAKLSFSLGQGGWAAGTLQFPAVEATEVIFQAKATDIQQLAVRFNDATGQTFQQMIDVAQDGQWHEVRISNFGSDMHWGGADDGVFHQPLSNVTLIVNDFQASSDDPVLLVDDVVVRHAPIQSTGPKVTMATGATGNIVAVGAALQLPVTSTAAYTWRMTDLGGAVVATGSGESGSSQLTVPTNALGHFTITLTASDDSGTTTKATTVGVLGPRPVAPLDMFGVSTHFGQAWDPVILDTIDTAGFSWARDEIYWGEVENTRGQYVIPQKSSFVNRLKADGVGRMIILSYGNSLYESGQAPMTPEGREAFANYAVRIVQEFGTTDVVDEVWNEWNIGLGSPTPDKSADAYFALMKVTVEKLRAEFPGIKLVGPGLAGADAAWLGRLMELGALDLLDGISIHPYVYPSAPESLDETLTRINALMDSHGKRIPVILSEHGWPTGTSGRAVADRTQAAYLLRAQAISAANDVAQYIVYDLVDDGPDPSNTEHRFGMLHDRASAYGAYTPKPSYVAQAVLMRQLDNAEFDARRVEGGVHDYRFTQGDLAVRMLWAPTGATVTVAASGPVTVTDMMGTVTELRPDATGKVTLGLDGEPVFLRGTVEPAAATATMSLAVISATLDAPLGLSWTVTNGGPASVEYRIDVEGFTEAQTVAAGAIGTSTLAGPVVAQLGDRKVVGVVSEGGVAVGRLVASATSVRPLIIEGRHVLTDDGSEALRLVLRNVSGEAIKLSGAAWEFAGSSGTVLQGASVPAGGEITHDLAIPAGGGSFTVTATPVSGVAATDSGRSRASPGGGTPRGERSPSTGCLIASRASRNSTSRLTVNSRSPTTADLRTSRPPCGRRGMRPTSTSVPM